jgi:uncharacterized protein YdaU (DUF1376 family)
VCFLLASDSRGCENMSWQSPEKATPGGQTGRSRREPGAEDARRGTAYHITESMRAAWWWIDRWRKSTAYIEMTLEEQGLYRNLLDAIWLFEDGIIPDTPKALVTASGGDPEAWARSGENVLRWMERKGRGWTNSTALEIKEKTQDIHEKKAAAGSKGGSKRQANAQAEAQANGVANVKPPSPCPSPLPYPDQSPENVSTEPPPTYPLPPDVRTETALRNERWRDERSLLAVVGQIAEKTGKEAGEVMEHVTAYKRRDGSRASGRRNPAQLRSHEAVVKSLEDAKEWLGDLLDGQAKQEMEQ